MGYWFQIILEAPLPMCLSVRARARNALVRLSNLYFNLRNKLRDLIYL